MKFIYPNRTTRLRTLTLSLGIIWAVATIALVFELPSPNRALLLLSFSFIIYYLLASFALQARTIAASLRR
jgi:phosphatidylcholine synthase